MIGNTQQMVFCIVNKPKKILKEEALLVIENLTGDALRECIAWLGN